MSSAVFFDFLPQLATTLEIPSTRGRFALSGTTALQQQALPTDPIGTFNLTLTNVVVGSSIQVEDQLGTTTLYNGTAGSTTVNITLSAYAAGSSLNDLRIKVRKGSASPYYQPWETLTTAVVGSQSIYTAQIKDE